MKRKKKSIEDQIEKEKAEKEAKKSEIITVIEANNHDGFPPKDLQNDKIAAIINWNAIKVDVPLADDETGFEDIDDEGQSYSNSNHPKASKSLHGMFFNPKQCTLVEGDSRGYP